MELSSKMLAIVGLQHAQALSGRLWHGGPEPPLDVTPFDGLREDRVGSGLARPSLASGALSRDRKDAQPRGPGGAKHADEGLAREIGKVQIGDEHVDVMTPRHAEGVRGGAGRQHMEAVGLQQQRLGTESLRCIFHNENRARLAFHGSVLPSMRLATQATRHAAQP